MNVSISPGYAYGRAPDQDHFLNRRNTKELFRDVYAVARARIGCCRTRRCSSIFSPATRNICAPWGMPTRNVFGWQKPCYLLGEGYARSFRELMDGTDWDSYGTGRYEKCANRMAHCGYEPTAARWMRLPIRSGVDGRLAGTTSPGPMAPEIDMTRPAQGRLRPA